MRVCVCVCVGLLMQVVPSDEQERNMNPKYYWSIVVCGIRNVTVFAASHNHYQYKRNNTVAFKCGRADS